MTPSRIVAGSNVTASAVNVAASAGVGLGRRAELTADVDVRHDLRRPVGGDEQVDHLRRGVDLEVLLRSAQLGLDRGHRRARSGRAPAAPAPPRRLPPHPATAPSAAATRPRRLTPPSRGGCAPTPHHRPARWRSRGRQASKTHASTPWGLRPHTPSPSRSLALEGPVRRSKTHASITTGTIIGRRLVRSLTNLPAARRTSRSSASTSRTPADSAFSTAAAIVSQASSRRSSASGA